jgi:hypothetical protein
VVRRDVPTDFGWNGYGVNYLHVIRYGPGWPGFDDPKLQGPQYLPRLARPAETLMIGDAQVEKGPEAGMGWAALYCIVELPAGVTWYRQEGLDKTWALPNRHHGGGNFILADGHVRWMRRETVIAWSREPGKELWGHYDE